MMEMISHSSSNNTDSIAIGNYRPMVIKLVDSFNPINKEERRDFMQSAYLALISANKTFDPTLNTKFSSYAWVAIRNELLKEKNKRVKFTTLPNDIKDKRQINIFDYLGKLNKTQKSIVDMKLQNMTFREIAKTLNITLWKVYEQYTNMIKDAQNAI